MKETNEISVHAARIYATLRDRAANGKGWMTAHEIASASEVAPRTARAYAKRFVDAGIVDLAEVFPAHRYRLSTLAKNRNRTYDQRLEQACEIFGIA